MRTALANVLLLLALAASAVGAVAAQRAAEAAPPLAITGIRIFDGQEVIPRGTVVVRGSTIEAAGADVLAPPGAT